MKKAKTVTKKKISGAVLKSANSLIKQIHKNVAGSRDTYTYKFYTCNGTFTGAVREVGADFVRIRTSAGYREHEDVFISMTNVCAVKEYYTGE